MGRPAVKTVLILSVMSLLFGGSFVASKSALAVFAPVQLIFLRFAISSVAFAVLLALRGGIRIDRVGFGQLCLISLMEPVLYFYLEAFGIARTLASTASILISTIPLFVLVLEAIWMKVKVPPSEWGLVAVSVAGIAVLVTSGGIGEAIGGSLVGNLCVLGASITASVYTFLVQRLLKKFDALLVTGFQSFFASAFFLPFAAWQWRGGVTGQIGVQSLLQVAYLGLGCSFLAYYLLNYSLSKTRAGHVAAFTNLIPVIATALAVIFLGERLYARQILGGILVLAGIVPLSMSIAKGGKG